MRHKLLLSCCLLASILSLAAAAINVPDKVPLGLRYPKGKTLYYRLRRDNVSYRMDGTKSSSQGVVTYFTRTRLDDDARGKVQERFVWKTFEFGQSLTAAPVQLAEFKAARDFALVTSVNEDMAIAKFDFSALPRTMDGFFFMILTWDAVTFDGLVRPTANQPIPDEASIGAEFSDRSGPHDFPFSYPPLVSESKYVFSGKNWIRVLGLSRVANIPCVLCEAAMLENTVEMNLRVAGMEIKTRGFENFWAKTYLALDDGRIVRGELVGPVAMIQDIQSPGQAQPQHSEFLVIGSLEMDLLPQSEFEAAVAKIRGADRK